MHPFLLSAFLVASKTEEEHPFVGTPLLFVCSILTIYSVMTALALGTGISETSVEQSKSGLTTP